MNLADKFPVACRVKIFLRIEIFYEGIVALHLTRPPLGPPIVVIEDGNKKQRTFVFFKKLDGTEGWTLIPKNPPSGFALKQEDPIYIITRVEIPEGTKRFSFIECTCPEREKEKHGHVFDEVERKNSPTISCPENAEGYFSFLKAHGRIIGNDLRDIEDTMKEIKEYFN